MTLTREHVVDLLTAAACYDNRKPSAEAVMAWTEASRRGRWQFREALDAVHEHYARSTEFLMPGHVAEAIRAARAQPAQHGGELEGPPPAEPSRIDAVVAAVGRKLGWRRDESGVPRREVLAQPCGFCGASVDQPCTRMTINGRKPTRFHPSRIAAAGEARS